MKDGTYERTNEQTNERTNERKYEPSSRKTKTLSSSRAGCLEMREEGEVADEAAAADVVVPAAVSEECGKFTEGNSALGESSTSGPLAEDASWPLIIDVEASSARESRAALVARTRCLKSAYNLLVHLEEEWESPQHSTELL